MPSSFEGLKVLIALLPGFLSQRIANYFGTYQKLSDINLIISALIFAFVNVVIAIPVAKLFKVNFVKDQGINLWFIFIILIMSLATGFGWAVVDRKDLLYKVGITSRVTQANLWTKLFVLNAENEKWKAAVKVTLKNDRTYIGWGRYWSEQQEQNNILFLKPAYVYQNDGKCCKVRGPGVLLFEREIEYIEFIRVPANAKHPCELQNEY